jgi:hypothetical protein
MDIKKSLNDIINVGIVFNVLMLIVGIFINKSYLLYITTIINIILLGTYIIIQKNIYLFQGMITVNKFAKGLSNKLEKING